MKTIMRRAAALCAAVIILASGCGSESEPAAVQDESTVETIEKIQIEIEYDGDEVLGDAIRKAADGFNDSQDIYEASVGSAGTNLQELTASVVFTDDNIAAAYASDYRRLDLRTCKSSGSGKASLSTIIDSLPEHMYETVCDEERGIFYLPVSVTAPVLYYNKTVFDGLGLSLPQTFSQLRDNSLSIYAKYRTPGYLPYDLEGDVVAMMREQEVLAAQSESGSESGVEAGNASTQTASGSDDNSDFQQTMTDAEVLQFFAGNCEAGYFRMVQHEASPALDFATGAVAAFAGTPEDYEMATAGVTFDVGTIPWIMDREDAIYWVDTSGMIFFDQGDERNAGAAAFAEYLLRDDVCSEFLESVGGLSPYRTVYESQAYRKNRRGFDEITMAASDEIQRADFVLMSDPKRRELDELLLYIIDKRVTAEDAVRIFVGS